MSRENVELVRRHYEAWNRGDVGMVVAVFAPDVEWHGHPRLPEPGPYRGRDQVERWMEQFREAWEELSAEPVELLDAGDTVVALVHMTGRGRGSGVEVQGGVDVHVLTLGRDGVTFFAIYPADLAASRAGLDDDVMEAIALRVQERLDDGAIARRVGRSEDEVSSALEGAFERLRTFACDEVAR
ncbi:MAG TPA: nuclear transport factor 2 family protein [Solirubrobacterales bacterium]